MTTDGVVSGKWSNDYRSAVMSTFAPIVIMSVNQRFLGKFSKKQKKPLLFLGAGGEATIRIGYNTLCYVGAAYFILYWQKSIR